MTIMSVLGREVGDEDGQLSAQMSTMMMSVLGRERLSTMVSVFKEEVGNEFRSVR